MDATAIMTRMLEHGPLALTPQERWQAAGAGRGSDSASGVFLVVVLLSFLAALAVALIAYAVVRRNRKWSQFHEQALQDGLSGEETELLTHLARRQRLRTPACLLLEEPVFNQCAESLLKDAGYLNASEEARRRLRGILQSLRAKLGFYEDETTNISTRQIPAGVELVLGDPLVHEVKAQVRTAGEEGLAAELAEDFAATAGETIRVRYPNLGAVWEFDAKVLHSEERNLLMEHTDAIRFANRRRFPRVPVARPACVAAVPFLREGQQPAALAPREARLVELAGPGMRLESDVAFRLRDRALLTVCLAENKIVQGFAKVRRVSPLSAQRWSVAFELIDLTGTEMAELTHQTNYFVQHSAGRETTENVPAHALT